MNHLSHIAIAACLMAGSALAQTPAPAPASVPAPVSTPATATAPASAPVSAAAEAAPAKQVPARKPNQDASGKEAAPGGARHLVWANSHTKRYHCYGAPYYGRTHQGAYTDETEAIEDGYKPSNGNGCSR